MQNPSSLICQLFEQCVPRNGQQSACPQFCWAPSATFVLETSESRFFKTQQGSRWLFLGGVGIFHRAEDSSYSFYILGNQPGIYQGILNISLESCGIRAGSSSERLHTHSQNLTRSLAALFWKQQKASFSMIRLLISDVLAYLHQQQLGPAIDIFHAIRS